MRKFVTLGKRMWQLNNDLAKENKELEYQVDQFKHQLFVNHLLSKESVLPKPPNHREDKTFELCKKIRKRLPSYESEVLDKLRFKYPFKTRLVPMNHHIQSGTLHWEIDGISIRLTEHQGKPIEKANAGIKLIMERNTEARIRTIQRRKDKLWVTLFNDLSQFNTKTCIVINDYVANLKKYFKNAVIEQVDFKIDSFGCFQVDNVMDGVNDFMHALKKGVDKMQYKDHGIAEDVNYVIDWQAEEEGLKVSTHRNRNTTTFLNANIFFERTPWNNNRKRKQLQKVELYYVKRYCKRNELIQKASVGQSIGTRVGRLIGTGHFEENQDPSFAKRIIKSFTEGLTRDEISVKRTSGLLNQMDGRNMDLDQSFSVVKKIYHNLNLIRKPLLERDLVQHSVWKIHQDATLWHFAHLKLNQVIIGDRRMTVLYARHQFSSYTTGDHTNNYSWSKCLQFLEEVIKRHCSIGATVEVYHHVDGYIGDVKKLGGSFCPIKIVKPLPGVSLPDFISLDDDILDQAEIDGWLALKAKVIKMFTKEEEVKEKD